MIGSNRRNLFLLVTISLFLGTMSITSVQAQEGPEMNVSTTLNLMHQEDVSPLYGYYNETEHFVYSNPPLANRTTWSNHTLTVSVTGPNPSIVVMIKDMVTREQTYLTNPNPPGGNAVEYSPFNTVIDMADYTQDRWYTLYIRGVSNGSSSSHHSRMFYLDLSAQTETSSPLEQPVSVGDSPTPYQYPMISFLALGMFACALIIKWKGE